jgi:hypothetical protein
MKKMIAIMFLVGGPLSILGCQSGDVPPSDNTGANGINPAPMNGKNAPNTSGGQGGASRQQGNGMQTNDGM